jgi:hypothetical protein
MTSVPVSNKAVGIKYNPGFKPWSCHNEDLELVFVGFPHSRTGDFTHLKRRHIAGPY